MLAGVYLNQWLTTFVQPFRAANTVACYRRAINALPPAVAGCELAELDGLAIQAALNQQALEHPRAAQLTFATLHVALSKAVELGYIQRNPVAACIKPKHEAKRAAVLTVPELAVYVQHARAEPCFLLLLIIATMGLRRSEALGLQWSAIDLAGCVMHIRQQRLRVDRRYQLRPLKSRSSVRTLPIPAPVAQELGAVRVRSFGFVCDVTPEAIHKAHKRVIERAGLPAVTLHGLRHSVATAAVSAGCPVKVLQGILGHSAYQLTADLYADHLDAVAYAPHLAVLATAVMG